MRRAVVVSTRVDTDERALIRALAAAKGVSVCEIVRTSLLPAVREHMQSLVDAQTGRRDRAGQNHSAASVSIG
jgi:hypothetical protein